MGRPAILRHFESDGNVAHPIPMGGGSWVASLPRANVQDPDIYRLARSTTDSTDDARFHFDFGVTVTRYVDLAVVLNHNFSAVAQYRITTGNQASGANPVYDSGLLDVWRAVEVWGANPWGGFGWDGMSYPGGFVSPPTLRHRFPAVRQMGLGGERFLHFYVADTGNPSNYVQMGRFIAGPVWQPAVGADFGLSVRVVDPSPVTRTPAGARIVGNDRRYRRAELVFQFLTEAEALGFVYEWARLGLRHRVWFEADFDRPDEAGDRRAFHGSLAEMPTISRTSPRYYTVRLDLEEEN